MIDLEFTKNTSDMAYAELAALHPEGGLPAVTRAHFEHDMPLLLGEIRDLRDNIDAVNTQLRVTSRGMQAEHRRLADELDELQAKNAGLRRELDRAHTTLTRLEADLDDWVNPTPMIRLNTNLAPEAGEPGA